MSKNEQRLLISLLLLSDALAIFAALIGAFYVRYNLDWLQLVERLEPITVRYQIIIPLAIPLWLVIFAVNRLYDKRFLLIGLEEYRRAIVACSMGILVLIVLSYAEPNVSISRSWLAFSWAFSILLVGIMRFLVRRLIKILRARGHFLSRAIIVGANEQAKAIVRQLQPATESGVQVIGFVDDFLPRDTRVLGDLRVLARPAALAQLAAKYGATEAIVVQGAVAWESFMEIITRSASSLNGLDIKLSLGFYELMATGVRVSNDGFVPLLALEKNRITGLDAQMKNLLDYSVSLAALVLVSPILLLAALAVKISSPGPIFEHFQNLGAGQKPYTTWKFRTRRDETHDHAFGRALYRSGIDKLPQFWSVLHGDMSLVGPRPIPVARADIYQEWLPTLLSVKPGLTGPWVVGGADAATLDAEIRLDLYYIRSWTIWLDLQIILQTGRRLFRGERPAVKR
jgi:lipopolysaccharide/colanic/teichoic acid biosynthesis glycosyltransferase